MITTNIENIPTENLDNEIAIKVNDIRPEGRHPEDILSRLCNNGFCFQRVQCGCMEAFLLSLRHQDTEIQRKVCVMDSSDLGYKLKWYPAPNWRENQTLWWKGKPIKRYSSDYRQLIEEAFSEMYLWSARFRFVLMQTENKKLTCNSGNNDPSKCLLTDREFCEILTCLRANRRNTNWKHLPRLWPNSYGVEEDYIF